MFVPRTAVDGRKFFARILDMGGRTADSELADNRFRAAKALLARWPNLTSVETTEGSFSIDEGWIDCSRELRRISRRDIEQAHPSWTSALSPRMA